MRNYEQFYAFFKAAQTAEIRARLRSCGFAQSAPEFLYFNPTGTGFGERSIPDTFLNMPVLLTGYIEPGLFLFTQLPAFFDATPPSRTVVDSFRNPSFTYLNESTMVVQPPKFYGGHPKPDFQPMSLEDARRALEIVGPGAFSKELLGELKSAEPEFDSVNYKEDGGQ